MSRPLLLQLLMLAALMLVLLVPLSLIEGVVQERQGRRQQVLESIRQSTSGPQRLAGPVLVVPYTVRTEVIDKIKENVEVDKTIVQENGQAVEKPLLKEVTREVTRVVQTSHERVILPETLAVEGRVESQPLYRGLYRALTYGATLDVTGSFALDLRDLAAAPGTAVHTPYLGIGVGDVRGLRQAPVLHWDGKALPVQPGNTWKRLGDGVQVPLADLDPKAAGSRSFRLRLTLQGMEGLHFSPVGKDTRVRLQADWPHPSFAGRFLPVTREVRDDGFTAAWQTSWFATNMDRTFAQGDNGQEQDFGVAFIQPVDTYQLTERAMKYGILFVLLTFTGVFLVELLRRLRVHPVQYLLVGAALALFFLLVIALSEHVPFAWSYLAASAACVVLVGFYLAFVLRHWRRGAGFGAMLGLLYAALYGLLQSEDHALLLGAGLTFGLLAAVMVLTRRLDWYAVGRVAEVEEA